MAIRSDLLNQFSDLGVDPNEEVLDKCAEICILNNIDVEEFVETWMAFSLSHLDGAEPTVETILQMERKEFANRANVMKTPQQDATTPLTVYNTSLNNACVDEEYLINCTTPKGRTPTRVGALSNASAKRLFSPASYSPITGTSSSKYKERTHARQVVLSHGKKVDSVGWRSSDGDGWTPAQVVVYTHHDSDNDADVKDLKNRLMMEPVTVKTDVLSSHIDRLSKATVDGFHLEPPSQFRHPNSERFVTVGCIYSSDGSRMVQNSVMLQASEAFSHGATIELNLQQLVQPNNTCTGLFPGQVVAVQGTNPIGDKMMVHKVFSPLPAPPPPPTTLQGALQIVVGAGPLTQGDNLLYEPLEDFVSYIKENEPHVAIIIGPVVDSTHPMVVDGSLAETYQELYAKLVTGLMDQLACCKTQVVVVASSKDAAQCPVFPTVPLDKRGDSWPKVMTVTDPSLLSLNGLVIGVSATDILMHLSREEMPLCNGGDRLGRLASHLLSQRNFYPLHPSPPDLPVDFTLWENLCNMPVTPHILILPSDLRYFIKNVGDCVVVNPERLAKGLAGGTFARLNVESSSSSNSWSTTSSITGQILKI